MSTSPTVDIGNPETAGAPAQRASNPLLICLPSMPSEAVNPTLTALQAGLAELPVVIASPDIATEQPAAQGVPALMPYPEPRDESGWVLTAQDYVAAARAAEERGASGVLLLGAEVASLQPATLHAIVAGLNAGADLAIPRYRTGVAEALANSALLYPVTRALFGADIRFPLPFDAGLSMRMLNRMASAAQRARAEDGVSLLWPVSEASVAGFSIKQVDGGTRALPQPQESDLNTIFPAVTGSLFADVEAKATYWQRARALPPRAGAGPRSQMAPAANDGAEEVRSLVENFRLAFSNLRDIWSLVLPPQSLLALKKLSASPPEGFAFAPGLWARSVYDFALAFHLRTLNRGHLLGALTPLYLGWVASFLRTAEAGEQAAADLLDATAAAFEQEKPYLVSRWRWPDRFNP